MTDKLQALVKTTGRKVPSTNVHIFPSLKINSKPRIIIKIKKFRLRHRKKIVKISRSDARANVILDSAKQRMILLIYF